MQRSMVVKLVMYSDNVTIYYYDCMLWLILLSSMMSVVTAIYYRDYYNFYMKRKTGMGHNVIKQIYRRKANIESD